MLPTPPISSTARSSGDLFFIPQVYTRKTSNASYSCSDATKTSGYPENMDTIHQRIKRLREKKELSMEELGLSVGVSWQTIQQWENGKTAPKRTRIDKVAEVLGVSSTELVSGCVSEFKNITKDVQAAIVAAPPSAQDPLMEDFYSLPTEEQMLWRSQIQAAALRNRMAQAEKAEMKAMMQALLNSRQPAPEADPAPKRQATA